MPGRRPPRARRAQVDDFASMNAAPLASAPAYDEMSHMTAAIILMQPAARTDLMPPGQGARRETQAPRVVATRQPRASHDIGRRRASSSRERAAYICFSSPAHFVAAAYGHRKLYSAARAHYQDAAQQPCYDVSRMLALSMAADFTPLRKRHARERAWIDAALLVWPRFHAQCLALFGRMLLH